MFRQLCLAPAVVLLVCLSVKAQTLDALMRRQDYSAARVSSTDPSGGNMDMRRIEPGQTLELCDLKGPGQITHIWFTYAYPSRAALRKLVIRAYFDDIEQPTVESPLGDFFGLGHAQVYAYASEPLAVGTHSGLNCYWPMPYAKRARLTLTNEGQQVCQALYYQVDYRTFDKPLPDALHFFASYRQQFPPRKGEPYLLLEADGGAGHYAGCSLSIEQRDGGWWGEGDTRVWVDGGDKPCIIGTGSEDDFGGAWCYSFEFAYPRFGTPLRGRFNAKGVLERCLTIRDTEQAQWRWPAAWQKGDIWNVYRWHIADPIPFTKSIRVNIEHGAENNERPDWLSSVACWYQSGNPTTRPALPPVADRIPYFMRPHDHGDGRWEAEDFLDSAKPTAGKIEEAGMDFWGDLFMGRCGLSWEPTDDGQTLELPFAVEKAGRYHIRVFAAGYEPGGGASFAIDGGPASDLTDLYCPPPIPQRIEVDLGQQELTAGQHVLKALSRKPNPAAKGRRILFDGFLVTPPADTSKP